MAIKTFGRTFLVVLALCAVVAAGASAAPTTNLATWRTGTSIGGMSVLSGTESMVASLTETGVLETEVAETPLKLKWTGTECLSCTIFNEGGGAKGTGQLKFTGVSVVTPAACAVSGGAITTVPLAIDATWVNGIDWGEQFRQVTGAKLATVTLQKGSGICPLAGSYNLTGTEYGKGINSTGTYSMAQIFQFSPTVNSTFTGSLGFAGNPATLTAKIEFRLSTNKLFGAF